MANQVVACTVGRCLYNEYGKRCALKELTIAAGPPLSGGGGSGEVSSAFCQSFTDK
ncbi:MAG: DUF1540 domain-containing protein [Thermaerobacter sp.]|nr:DUF1540 domain-containing protein [Thermaerobacter sp.]